VKITLALPIIAIGLIGASARPSQATEITIKQMPAKLEAQFALSALPPAMRDHATVPGFDKLYKGEHFSYLLDTDFVELRNAIRTERKAR
jgi:hypothetical protein